MVEEDIICLPAIINDSEILIDGEINGQAAILSTKIADRFHKQHKNILRDIDQLQSILPTSFVEANFRKTYYELPIGNGATRKSCAFLLTRDAFSLLVMGMTGKAAVIWKLRYIEAFNALEKAAIENSAAKARAAGYQDALKLPALEAERKKGYLAGLKEGQKFRASRDGLHILRKILDYQKKGLSYSEIGKLLDISKSNVGERLQRARSYGLLAAKPVQATLPGVE